MSDPTRDLENFGTGGIMVTPLPPSEVRRQGDRRRGRRRAGTVVASIAVLAAVVVPVALVNRDGGGSSTPPPVSHPTKTATPRPETVTYPDPGVFVTDEADTAKLTGTSAAFKSFIAAQARKAVAYGEANCSGAGHGITVQKYSTNGYALGAVNDCGGYVALWVVVDDQWQEGIGTQDVWDCDSLAYLGVPRSFAGQCADEAGDFGPDQVSGLRLGMTQAQVEAAGGQVQGKPGSCQSLTLPDQSPIKNQTDGYLAPTDGLVLVEGRPDAKTPKRIGLGSSAAKVKAAYPNGHLSSGYWVVPLSGNAEYEFQIGQGGSVVEMILARPTQPCTQ